jgi:periplasmic protein TonB
MTNFGHFDDTPFFPRPEDDANAGLSPGRETSRVTAEPESMAVIGPMGYHPVSVDLELDRIVERLDVLHETFVKASGAQQTAPKPIAREPQLFAGIQARHASVQVFSSTVRSLNRRDYVVGFSISTASPLINGFPRVWHIMAGIALLFWGALWIGSRYLRGPGPAAASAAAAPAQRSPLPAAVPPAPANHPISVTQPKPAPAETATSATVPSGPRDLARSVTEPAARAAAVPTAPAVRKAPVRTTPHIQTPDKGPPLETGQLPSNAPRAQIAPGAINAIRKIASQADLIAAQGSDGAPAGTQPTPVGREEQDSAPKAAPSEAQDSPPVATIKILPEYPDEARRTKLTGQVDLVVSIDENGKVTQASPVSGPEPLHAAAVEAMMQWHFRPAVRDGKSVPATMKYSLTFGGEN